MSLEYFTDRPNPLFISKVLYEYTKFPRDSLQPLPLHSPKVTVRIEFPAVFIIGFFFFEDSNGNVMNLYCATSSFQHCNSIGVRISQFYAKVKQQQNLHWDIISHRFPTAFNFNPCDLWLWGVVYSGLQFKHLLLSALGSVARVSN
ncbi:hypothetical protein TNCV_3247801 [Trichonephila clavipes]|nr:hypothetical protein TNCV_3247801 [Trichonephila clavipes]